MIAVMWGVHVGVTGWQWAIRDGGSTVRYFTYLHTL